MNGRTSFLLHLDSLDVLNDLTDSECGQLLKAMVAWQKGDEIELDKVIKVSFSPFKNQFIRDNLKYEKTVKARQGAGSKGGKAKADNIKQELANASKSKQELANLAVSVSDSVSDNVSDSNKTLIPIRGKSPDWMDEYKTAFWSAYLKKVDKSKTMTLLTKMIKKKPDVEHWQMVLNHIQQKAIVTEKQYWPAPTRFLRDELWQDELPIVGENNGQHKQLNQQSAKPTAAERVRARAELKRAERRNAEPSVGGISADIRQQPDHSVGRGNAPSLGNLIERASSKSNLGGLGNT